MQRTCNLHSIFIYREKDSCLSCYQLKIISFRIYALFSQTLMTGGILEVLLVNAEGIQHPHLICISLSPSVFRYNLHPKFMFVLANIIVGKPTYYLIAECGAQVHRTKISSGLTPAEIFFSLTECKRNATWFTEFVFLVLPVKVKMIRLGGMKNSCLNFNHLILEIPPIWRSESRSQDSSVRAHLLEKPCM